MYPNVHRSAIYNSWDVGAASMSISRRIKKVWGTYTMECYAATKRNAFESVPMRWMACYTE